MNLLTHDLRKFFGSFLIAHLGVDVITVSKWMGHTNLETTTRIYARLTPELEKQHRFTIGFAFGA